MKIAYTYHGISSHKIGGVARYFFEVISRLRKKNDITILSKYSQNLYFTNILKKKEFLQGINFAGKWRIVYMLQEINLKRELKKGNFDLIHHTGENSNIFSYIRNTPIVLTIHDFIPEIYNYQPDRIEDRKMAIQNASAIICVSENTKQDLIKFFPNLPSEKIHVIYHGFNAISPQYNDNQYGKYILYVGARTTYKNFPFLIQSVAKLIKERNIQIVCTGGPFTEEEKTLFSKLNISDHLHNCGYVSDNELNNLYHHAVCFVYPSLYEGFGIPILEAFGNKCPVCLSNASCFPEIASDSVSYFDPQNSESIEKAIKQIIVDPNYRSKLIEKGSQRLKYFSWDRAASQTEEVYKQVLKTTDN